MVFLIDEFVHDIASMLHHSDLDHIENDQVIDSLNIVYWPYHIDIGVDDLN